MSVLRSIGLLGGAFNPPHAGHVQISKDALARLGLDEIWWLVADDHPTKTRITMPPLSDRMAACEKITAQHPQIQPTDIEHQEGTRYTFDTVRALQRIYPQHRFIWLMGADNLVHLHTWHEWESLLGRLPFAIFHREPWREEALTSKAAKAFANARVAERDAKALAACRPPAWCYLEISPHPASSSSLRAEGKTLGGER